MLLACVRAWKVDLDRFDQRDEPREQLLMRRVLHVAVKGILVGKLHDAAEFIALAARRDVATHPALQHGRNVMLQLANFTDAVILLLFGNVGLKSKRKHVDVHGYWLARLCKNF